MNAQAVLDYLFLVVLLCSTKHADSIDLELEVDPLNVDHFSCTPLVSDLYFTIYVFSVFVIFFMPVCDLCLLVFPDVGMCSGSY